jgi:hypothetical protein
LPFAPPTKTLAALVAARAPDDKHTLPDWIVTNREAVRALAWQTAPLWSNMRANNASTHAQRLAACSAALPESLAFLQRDHRGQSALPLIIGAGEGNSGTSSVASALGLLGLNAWHYWLSSWHKFAPRVDDQMRHFITPVTSAPNMANVSGRLAALVPPHIDAVLDTPVAQFFPQLFSLYPCSRVILTEREPQRCATEPAARRHVARNASYLACALCSQVGRVAQPSPFQRAGAARKHLPPAAQGPQEGTATPSNLSAMPPPIAPHEAMRHTKPRGRANGTARRQSRTLIPTRLRSGC